MVVWTYYSFDTDGLLYKNDNLDDNFTRILTSIKLLKVVYWQRYGCLKCSKPKFVLLQNLSIHQKPFGE
jgi:hypothetical protein